MEARVIAVADVVEAMLSDRPHRPALSVAAAMKEIESGKGTLYDPNAVDACVRLFGEGKFQFDAEEQVTRVVTPSVA
jgi:HD-GYP domain-containing protein (c-di-GMP phosphodiesterase class II)